MTRQRTNGSPATRCPKAATMPALEAATSVPAATSAGTGGIDGSALATDSQTTSVSTEEAARVLAEESSSDEDEDAPPAALAAAADAPRAPALRQTKAALLREKVLAPGGASLADLMQMTGWQAHTLRAALTGLRKSGLVLTRRREGTHTIYGVEGAELEERAADIAAAAKGETAAAGIDEPAETGASDPTLPTPAAPAQPPANPAAGSLDLAPVSA